LLRRCMAKNIEDRPASPGAVATELRRIQRDIGFPEKRARKTAGPLLTQDSDDQTGPRNEPSTQNRTVLREVTSRPSASSADDEAPDVEAQGRSSKSNARRGLLIGAVTAIGLVTAGVVLTGGEDTPALQSTATSAPETASAAAAVVILSPPEDVTVTSEDDNSLTIDWTVIDGSLKYQINEVGTSDNRIVDAPPYNWSSEDDAGSDCFTIRTVNAEETKMSQSTSAPVCPD